MITVKQYNQALEKLSDNQLNILKNLYLIEPVRDSTIIAQKLGYKGWGGANLQIGKIGKAICRTLNIDPDLSVYNPNIIEGGYFIVIHRQYKENGIYWEMEPNLRRAIENLPGLSNSENNKVVHLPTEIDETLNEFPEGFVTQVLVNRYERSKSARIKAILEHGNKCVGCQIDFKAFYGPDINEIIEIHHIVPLKEKMNNRSTNPTTDLFPLCPNCHAVVHSTSELMSIEELKKRVAKYRR